MTTSSEGKRTEQFRLLAEELRRHRRDEVESEEAQLVSEKLSGLLSGSQEVS